MQAYFRMNNEILDLGLSPNELKETSTKICKRWEVRNLCRHILE